MQLFLSTTQDWRRPFWLVLMIVSSIVFTFAFACAAPFAAFAAATALTLQRRDAVILMLGVWMVNQLTGFLFMNYPWDANTFAWGAALGMTALVSMFAARTAASRLSHLPPLICCTLAFLVDFMAYEVCCYVSALVLGGVEDFTFTIQSRIVAINACALVGLFALNRVGL
jgi:hypothetical protein